MRRLIQLVYSVRNVCKALYCLCQVVVLHGCLQDAVEIFQLLYWKLVIPWLHLFFRLGYFVLKIKHFRDTTSLIRVTIFCVVCVALLFDSIAFVIASVSSMGILTKRSFMSCVISLVNFVYF